MVAKYLGKVYWCLEEKKKRTRRCIFINNTDIGKFKKSIGALGFESLYHSNKKHNTTVTSKPAEDNLFNGKQKRRKKYNKL